VDKNNPENYNHLIQQRGHRYGWPTSSITTCTLLLVSSNAISDTPTPPDNTEALISKGLIAVISVLLAQAVIPVIKAFLKKRSMIRTFRSYLWSHTSNTLESFGGAGSTEFAFEHLLSPKRPPWLEYLHEHNLGLPSIFLTANEVIEKARESTTYIPSISYPGAEEDTFDHTSPVWELDGPESAAAMKYFLTQQQVSNALEYLYKDWYFELIKNGNLTDRQRWCLGMENVLYDMAENYHATLQLHNQLSHLRMVKLPSTTKGGRR
jgi:hypothetical protein